MDATRQLLLFNTTAFSPASISGMHCWVKADAGVFQDAARTTAATADGDPVGGWADQSGNGRHFSQSTAASRGTLKLSIFNGRNIVRFDGVDDYLSGTVLGSKEYTLCTANRYNTLSGNNVIWRNGNDAADGLEISNNAGSFSIFHFNVSGISGGAMSTNLEQWTIRRTDAAGTDARKNGSSQSLVGSSIAMILPTTTMLIGARTPASNFAGMDLCELIVWNRKLTDAETTLVESYLNARWSIF